LSSTALEVFWKHVLDHWDDDKAHSAFIDHCNQTGQLAEAAARYRGMTGDRDRGPAAHKRLQGVAVLAMAALESSRSPRREARPAFRSLFLIAFFALSTLGLLAWLNATR
jgi:hypothetical protein